MTETCGFCTRCSLGDPPALVQLGTQLLQEIIISGVEGGGCRALGLKLKPQGGGAGGAKQKNQTGGPRAPSGAGHPIWPPFSEGTSAAPTACHTCCENDTPRRMVPSLPPGRAIGHHTQSRNRHGPLISLEWLGFRVGGPAGPPRSSKAREGGLQNGGQQ